VSYRFRINVKRAAWLILFLPGLATGAPELRIAVAANFLDTMEVLAETYTRTTEQPVVLSSGSTGKLYAQILNGAPYDLFFSADTERPDLLKNSGFGTDSRRFDYAVGRLVMWSPSADNVGNAPPYISANAINFVAIANPKLAPYGRAAKQTLEFLKIWDQLQGKLVRGENINQAYNFVRSGNADIGMVALSQLIRTQQIDVGSHWLIPESIYTPIVQAGLVISDKDGAENFAAFIQSSPATRIIEQHGYGIPE